MSLSELRILELFSGIGGMHFAFQYSNLPGHVVAAYDINTVVNSIYSFNHATTTLKNNNIQSVNSELLNKLKVNTLLMSPPCQPHTRVGNKLDIEDNRSDALQHLCSIIPDCQNLCYILMENVKGFEKSKARQNFISALATSGFNYCEVILSPTQFGIPNTRNRYYCLARKYRKFSFPTDQILEAMPLTNQLDELVEIHLSDILESNSTLSDEFLVGDKDLLKRTFLMDIVTADAKNTMCFTKAYTHYIEGTGSIFTPLQRKEMDDIFRRLEALNESNDDEKLELLQSLRLRFFTPREVARLMSFPESFGFPSNVTNRQKYRALGNSLNVVVVGELIKLLCS